MLGKPGRFLGCAAALLVLATGARATIVVDPAGGGDFTTLQEALIAAGDGEQILVKAGTYGGPGFFSLGISGKGLSITAEAGEEVIVLGLTITNVPAGHWVVLRGLNMDTTLFGSGVMDRPTLDIQGPTGAVLVEDCFIKGGTGLADTIFPIAYTSQPAVSAMFGGSLTLERCTIVGGKGWPAVSTGSKWGPGLGSPGVVVSGRVALHDCTVIGGQGGSGENSLGGIGGSGDGAPGVKVNIGGTVHIAGSTVTGGSNGDNLNILTDKTGDGLQVLASGSAWIRHSSFAAGSVVNVGVAGQDVVAPPGSLTTLAAPPRAITITSPLREGQAGTLQIQGQQGDEVVVLVALGAGYAPLLSKQGVFALETSVLLLPISLGTITDPGGTLSLPFVTPNLNPVLDGLTVPMQLVVKSGGVTTLEGATVLAWLDARL